MINPSKNNKTNIKSNTKSYNKNKHNNKINITDIKLKPLMPTLRQKKRFIKVRIESNVKYNFKELSENLIEEIIFYFGAVDFGKSGIWILRDKFDYDKQEIVLKVGVKMKDKLVGVLALIKKINTSNVKLSIIRVSGTFKGLEKQNNE